MAIQPTANSMQIITANISGNYRKDQLDGRDYYVVPISLIVPGVLNGSNGPIYYPPEENAKSVMLWNGMPLVLRHPFVNGKPASARTASILNSHGIGMVLAAKNTDRLVAEAWIDIKKANALDTRIVNKIESNEPIEISTGLVPDYEPAPEGATHNNQPYHSIARNYRPDHVAILLDEQGACSNNDGCGINVNSEQKKSLLSKFKDWLGVDNELSHDQLRDQLHSALRSKFKQSDPGVWIDEVFDDHFVYRQDDELFKQNYTKSDLGVQLIGDPSKVIRKVEFIAANQEDSQEGESEMADNNDQKKPLVDHIITNCSCWSEDDRETLNSFSEDKLKNIKGGIDNAQESKEIVNAAKAGFETPDGQTFVYNSESKKMELKKPEKKEEPTTNTETKRLTEDEWEAQAPQTVINRLKRLDELEQRERDELLDKLTANVADDKKEAVTNKWKDRSIEDLRDAVELLPAPKQQPQPSYYGQGAPVGNASKPVEMDEQLVPPVINYGVTHSQSAD